MAQEERRLAVKMAYETHRDFNREEQQSATAKQALKEFLLQNEENKKIKEEVKQKQVRRAKACLCKAVCLKCTCNCRNRGSKVA